MRFKKKITFLKKNMFLPGAVIYLGENYEL